MDEAELVADETGRYCAVLPGYERKNFGTKTESIIQDDQSVLKII